MGEHRYDIDVSWTGATTGYRSYSRDHELATVGPPPIPGSADPMIGRGDPNRWNPEQLFVAALSSCHMLWYLHLCADAGIVIVEYRDTAFGIMSDTAFTAVTLRPTVATTSVGRVDDALALHAEAHTRCFLANSVNFPVLHQPTVDIRTC